MYIKEAIIDNESHTKLAHLPVWKDSPLFSVRENAAFKWAEALTRISFDSTNDNNYDEVREYFDEKELASLTFVITIINTWNRLAVAFRTTPGSLDNLWRQKIWRNSTRCCGQITQDVVARIKGFGGE